MFGVRVIAGGAGLQLELPRDLDQRLTSSDAPHLALAEALIRSIEPLDAKKTEFAVAFVYLPDRWQHAFRTDDDDFDLHDYVKAFAAGKGIAVQFLNEGSALKYSCRCSVMWRLGIATYCKAGGTPWTVADIEEDTAFLALVMLYVKRPLGAVGSSHAVVWFSTLKVPVQSSFFSRSILTSMATTLFFRETKCDL